MAKLSLSRAWDETRDVLASDGKLIGAVALALFFLPGVLAGVIRPDSEGLPKTASELLLVTAVAIIGVIGQLAIIRLALGTRSTVGDTIRQGAMRAPSYIAAGIIWLCPILLVGYFLAGDVVRSPETAKPASSVAFLIIFCVLIFLSVRMLMTSSVATAERANPVEILRRSWQLTSGNWWRLFGFLCLFLVVALVALGATGAIVGIISGVLFGAVEPMTVAALFVAFFVELVTTVITAGFLVMLARLYVQLTGPEVGVPSSGT